MTVVTSGRFVEHFPGRDVDCQVGTVFTKPPGERHRDTFYGSRQVILEPRDPALFTFRGRSPFASVSAVIDPRAAHLARRLSAELADVDEYAMLAVEGLTLELIAMASKVLDGRSVRGRRPKWLVQVQERLSSDPRPATMHELGEIAQESPSRVARMFRAHYGLSIAEFARRERLMLGVTLLVESDESLSSIAMRCGFADQSHFTRVCQRYLGTTPWQYRQQHKA